MDMLSTAFMKYAGEKQQKLLKRLDSRFHPSQCYGERTTPIRKYVKRKNSSIARNFILSYFIGNDDSTDETM